MEQRLGAYRQLLQKVMDEYNQMYEDTEYARRISIAIDFDAEWEQRVHRYMTEKLRDELLEEIRTLRKSADERAESIDEALREYTDDLERRATKMGYKATNALPRPPSEPSAQQSSKVRNEASKRLSELRRTSP